MARRAVPKNNFSKGVLDPLLHERVDLEQFHQGMLEATNVIVLPQGGVRNRGGLRHRTRLRRRVRRLHIEAAAITAPNGGTVANAVDQNTATEFRTASGVSGDPFVVLQVALGSSQQVVFVDTIQLASQSANADAALKVQTSTNGTTWTDIGRALNLRTTARTRRFATDPGTTRAATHVRVVVVGAPTVGTIGLKEIRVWVESSRLSPLRRLPFTFSVDQTYTLIATDRNIDVFRRGEWQCSIPTPFHADLIGLLTRAQKSDLMLLFHPEVQTHTIFRQGAHWEWDSYPQTFTNIPTLTGGATFGAAQDEIQRVTIENIGSTDTLQMVVEDQYTSTLTRGSDGTVLAAAIKSALEALVVVDTGLVVTVTELSTTRCVFEIRFAGANSARSWPSLYVDVFNDGATVATEVLQDGRPASGSLMSAQTGWPRCGTFYQSRLIVGGFLLRPETLIGSVTASFFNFDQDAALEAEAGVEYSLDSDELAVIQHIFVGRHLQIFTDSSEWYLSDRTLDATQALTFVNSTRFGSRPGMELVQVEGATQFVQASGNVVREFVYSDVEQDYAAPAITLLASHLVTDVVDLAYRRASSTSEGSQLYMVNADGTLAMMTYLRAEKVMATVPITTPGGKIRSVNIDAGRRVDMVIERTVSGVTNLYLEDLDDSLLLDGAIVQTLAPAATTVTGLAIFEGRSVYAIADGYVEGPFTVAGAQITLPRAAASVEVGLDPGFAFTPMPHMFKGQDGAVRITDTRVVSVMLSLYDTTDCTLAANGGAAQTVPLQRIGGEALDRPTIDNPFTGDVIMDRLYGGKRGGRVTVSRSKPGRITVRAALMEVA
jgi:hypothetical protein